MRLCDECTVLPALLIWRGFQASSCVVPKFANHRDALVHILGQHCSYVAILEGLL